MRRVGYIWITWCITVPAVAQSPEPSKPSAAAADPAGWAGAWSGLLDVGPMKIRIIFNVARQQPDGYSATIDSPDQNVMGIPVTQVRVRGEKITLSASSIGGVFKGTREQGTIKGAWTQGGRKTPLDLARGAAAAAVNRPQTPKPPFPYDDETVRIENPQAKGVTLAGTLTLPHNVRPAPAVLLISGSGPQDRDEFLLSHRPFAVLADHLARQGIAVLRCDDRGVGESTGDFAAATTRDFASDAAAALAWLRTRPEIAANRIGLIGHSEGGLIAPIVAAEPSHGVAFMVLMAGLGVPGEEIIMLQGDLLSRAAGEPEPAIAAERKVRAEIFAVLKSEPDQEMAAQKLKPIIRAKLEQVPPAQRGSDDQLDQLVQSRIDACNTAWFRFFLTYDPRPGLARVTCPVLALNGEKDLQVDPKQNLPEIVKALKAGGNRNVTTIELPGLNHLFQSCTTGSSNEYGSIEETLNPAAMKAISDWLKRVAGEPVRKAG